MLADTSRRYGAIFEAFAFNAGPFGVEISLIVAQIPPKIHPFGLHFGSPGGVLDPTSFLDRYSPLKGVPSGALWGFI